MRTLIVTSPWMQGEDVTEALRILAGQNRYKEDYLNGPEDGKFGPEAGRAARRAKWWMGYPEEDVRSDKSGPVYGQKLHKYLTGVRKLPESYERRRRARIQDKPKKTMGDKILEQAVKHIGYTETRDRTSGNINKFGEWYGYNRVAWCAMFVSYCAAAVGSKAFAKGSRYAYCPFIVNDARAGSNGLSIVRKNYVRPGDLVLYNWDGDWDADHIGIFEDWVDKVAGTFRAVEGNTSRDDAGNQSNGGGVFRRGEAPGQGDTRKVSQVQAFIRVGR